MSRDTPRARSRHAAVLLVLLAVAFLARAGLGLLQPADDAAIDRLPDQREYLALARSLLAERAFHFYDPRFNDVVYAFRTPGYPAWVAALGASIRAVRLAQAALDTSTVLCAYLLAVALLRKSPDGWAALAAGGIVAVNPFLIYFSGLLLSETLFTAMLAWGMLLLVVGGRGARLRLPSEDITSQPRPRLGTVMWLAGGLLLALAGLVRPSAVPLAVGLGIVAAFVNRAEGAAYDRYRPSRPAWPLPVGTTMLLLTVLVLLPWGMRNRRVVGQWVWTTTNDGVTLYDGFNPDADGGSDQSFLRDMPQLKMMGEVGRSQYLSAKAKEYIRDNPRRAAELAVIKAARTWSPVPLSPEFGSRRNVVVALAYAVPFDLLVLAGLLGSGLPRAAKAFLLAPAVYFTAVHMLSVGSLRYRIPVEPPLAVVAASVFARPRPTWRRAAGETGEGTLDGQPGLDR